MNENHALTVRLNVPLNSEEVGTILDTLKITGEIQEEREGVVVIIKAETLNEIRQTVDDVLVALGDL